MAKPRLFIGSSSESYDVASACNACMDRKVEVTLWDKIFNPGGDTLSSLLNKAINVDFALFIFNPEDITIMRSSPKPTIRDNVLFELGLFIGAIGKERCFILKPRDQELHIPTDLLGINTHDYDPFRTDNDLESAVNAACTRFNNQIDKLGSFSRQSRDLLKVEDSPINHNFTVSDEMMKILAKLLPTMTDQSSLTANHLNPKLPEYKFNLSLIKLEKLHLIEKVIDCDFNGNEWFAYKLTQDALEFMFENETRLDNLMAIQQKYNPPHPAFDDNIPF
jgi:hypothetical protein